MFLIAMCNGCSHQPQIAYPQSPQWHGTHFENPPEWPKRLGVAAAIRWQLSPEHREAQKRQRAEAWRAPCLAHDDPARVTPTSPSVTWIGHASTLIQTDNFRILTDPVFSESSAGIVQRFCPAGLSLREVGAVDVVVISHSHYDHLDEPSVRALSPQPLFIVPLGMASWFKKRGMAHVIELDWWQSYDLTRNGRTLHVTMVPAQHWSQRTPTDADKSLWGGYVFQSSIGGAEKTIYFAGDTGYPAAFRAIGARFKIDLALLPIGAYEPRTYLYPQHMTPEQAAVAFTELGAGHIIGIHWGTFPLADEPLTEPPKRLYEALGPLKNRIIFLPIGGSFVWPATK